MTRTSQLLPYVYVDHLHCLIVPGYDGYPGGQVALTRYISANTKFGGAVRALVLLQALQNVTAKTSDAGTTRTEAFRRVFTGQGMPDDQIVALELVMRYKTALAKNAKLAPYFKEKDYLQALCDNSFFGQDCIGFVGTYCAVSGIDSNYVGRRPLDFLSVFKPAHSLADINAMSVVAHTNGLHVQIVDWVWERHDNHLVIDLCQSTGSTTVPESNGPQCNNKVTLKAGGGSYLPVEEFRQVLSSRSRWTEYEAAIAEKKAKGNDKGEPTPEGYEAFLRKTMTVQGRETGYMGASIFQLVGNGDPQNPMGGSVYVGTMPGLRYVGS